MATGDRHFQVCETLGVDRYLLQLVADRHKNDQLRTRMRGGKLIIAENVKALGNMVAAYALLMMAETDCWEDEEHSRGRFIFCGRAFEWKIESMGNNRTISIRIGEADV